MSGEVVMGAGVDGEGEPVELSRGDTGDVQRRRGRRCLLFRTLGRRRADLERGTVIVKEQRP